MLDKIRYWHRIISTYIFGFNSNLSFWHGNPELNESANYKEIGQYYMKFRYKADYNGHFDKNGIPMLNYHGDIGLQYNPIAISQWGLGNYNFYKDRTNSDENYQKFIRSADWLVENLKKNSNHVYVWNHTFNWVYKQNLISPWYSGLAQGQGLSVLVRAYNETKEIKYMDAINKVIDSFNTSINNGGVTFTDSKQDIWLEEYIVNPPTHILNGFIWGIWGLYDYWLLTNNKNDKAIFDKYIKTIQSNLYKYDIGYWSLYELSGLRINMIASKFYHKLHIVQLKILFTMTNIKIFEEISDRWESYLNSKINIYRSTIMKIIFKIFYY